MLLISVLISHVETKRSRFSEIRKKSSRDLLSWPDLGRKVKSSLSGCRALKGSERRRRSANSARFLDLAKLGGAVIRKTSILSGTSAVEWVRFQSPPYYNVVVREL